MKINFLKLSFACIILFAISCSRPASNLSLYIPKDASAVFIINPKSITDKIASSGITIDSFANLFTKQNDQYALRWSDIENSGIDLNNPVYIFAKSTNSMQQGLVSSGALIASITDEKKLEAFLAKEKVGGNILTADNYKYYALGNDYVAGWTDKVLIISRVSGGNAAPGNYSTGQGTSSQTQLTTLFSQKESASIASVDGFNDLLSKQDDVRFYSNSTSKLNSIAIPGLDKVSTLLDGSYTEGTINFEKGRAIASTEFHAGKALADILEKYPSKEINTAAIKNYPDSLTGFGIVSFNPKVLVDILQYLGFDTMVNGFATNVGFTLNDVVNAFSGDVAFMFSKGSAKASEDTMPGNTMKTMHPGNFIVSFTIGDKAAFNKVLAGLVNKSILTKNGDYYQLGEFGGHGFVIAVTDDKLIIGSSDELITAYKTAPQKSSLPQGVEKEINNKSMALYVDINSLLNDKNADQPATIHLHDKYFVFANSIQAAKATFKNFIATSNKGDGKKYTADFELNFVNADENSLASLAKFIAFAHKEDIENRKNKSSIFMDSIPSIKDEPEKDSQ
jgi:hypothetical protein